MSTFNSNKEDLRALNLHPDYNIEGADLFFLVERIHFKVHRYFFDRESPYFRAQLEMPVSAGGATKGSNRSNAIDLSGVKASEFELFLWVFYNPTYSLYDKTVDDWEVILRLAEEWTFSEVKNLAVRELEKLTFPDVDRVAIYQAHAVDRNLLIPPCSRLCEREETFQTAEGHRLGMDTFAKFARAREVARRGYKSCASGSELDAIVREVFDIPATDTQASQTPGPKAKEGNTNGTPLINGVNGGERGEGHSGRNASTSKPTESKPSGHKRK